MANPDEINAGDVVQNMDLPSEQIITETQETIDVPQKTGETPIESQFTTGDFTEQYMRNQDAQNEMNKLFASQFPDKPSTTALAESTYYPGINDPILKGMSSSKTLGSQPIFVRSGGFFPFGVLDARKKALQDAAKERAKQLRAFDLPKKPLTKDPRFQETLNQNFDRDLQSVISEAKSVYGDKALWALQNDKTNPYSMKLRTMLDNYDVLARETDQVTNMIAEIKKGITDKTMAYSPETKTLVDDYEKLINQFEGGKVDVDLRKNLNALKGSQAIDVYLNKYVFPDLEAEVNQAWGQFKNEGDLNVARSGKTSTYKKIARNRAKLLKETEFKDQSWLTEDDIYNRIISTKGDKFEQDIRSSSNPDAGTGYDVQSKDELNRQNNRNVEIGDVIFNMKNAVDLKTRKNSKAMNISGGLFFTKGANGEFIQNDLGDNTEFIPYTFGDAEIDGNTRSGASGVIVSKREETDESGNTIYTYNAEGDQVPKMIETKTPAFLDERGQQAKFSTEMPVSYGFFKEGSSNKLIGVDATKTITTDKKGNEKGSTTKTTTTTTKKGGVDVTNIYE